PKNIPVALVLLWDRRYILPARKFQVVVMSTILADYGLPALGALSIGVKAFSMPKALRFIFQALFQYHTDTIY
ncbi:MAG: hypothetical protein OEZ59_13745, partial [Deltaproteobacteria bacterium]|nr:hypothetical protein [Deltaproteobacteria bacterium]